MFRAPYWRSDSEPSLRRRTRSPSEDRRRARGRARRAAGRISARCGNSDALGRHAGGDRRLLDRLAGGRLLRGRKSRHAGGFRPFADQAHRVRPARLFLQRRRPDRRRAAAGEARGGARRNADRGSADPIRRRRDRDRRRPRDLAEARARWSRRSAPPTRCPACSSRSQVEGRWLFDGAIVNPVPVSVARALGAERVIAFNISSDGSGRGTAIQDPFGRAEPPPVLDEPANDSSRRDRALVARRRCRGSRPASRIRRPRPHDRHGQRLQHSPGPHHALAAGGRSARRAGAAESRQDRLVRISSRRRTDRDRTRGGPQGGRRNRASTSSLTRDRALAERAGRPRGATTLMRSGASRYIRATPRSRCRARRRGA